MSCSSEIPNGKIYTYESDANHFNTNTIFYDDGKEVVAFDAQFTNQAAEEAIAFLKTKTDNPINYLVVTHPNPDKFNGIPAFKKIGAKVIMSEDSDSNLQGVHDYKKYYFTQIAESFTEENYPKMVRGDVTFKDDYTVDLANGGKINLTEFHQSGISNNQTVAFIENENALIVGDLVHHNAHAWLEGPIVDGTTKYSTRNWTEILEKLKADYPNEAKVYGGRGTSANLEDALEQQVDYLNTAEQIVRDYLAHTEEADFTEVQKLFEAKFPDYTLGYMINYGAYGLAESVK